MNEQLIYSLISGLFVGGAAGYLGSLMIGKRMALVGDALGHAALPGMGLALLLGLDVSLGAFVFLMAGILLVWAFNFKKSLPMEAAVGIVFVASLALGFLIVPQAELLESLIGDISRISLEMAVFSAFFSIFLFWAVRKVYPALILANISEDLASMEGLNMRKYNLAYLFCIALIVSLGIKMVGSLLIGALVIVPAAAARNLSRNLNQYVLGSVLLGSLSSLAGIFFSGLFQVSAGPLVVLASVFLFLVSLLFKSS
jgi:ABC-type Mn2+/Zn2+ transport system permease subunit